MKRLLPRFAGLLRDESGATAIEYALIGGLVSIAIVVAATQMGSTLSNLVASILPGLQGS
jgi:pilus assembly protein Flp/PilA